VLVACAVPVVFVVRLEVDSLCSCHMSLTVESVSPSHASTPALPHRLTVAALTPPSLASLRQLFHYVPSGDGEMTVASDDPFLSENVDITLSEHSENILVLTAVSHLTGVLLAHSHRVASCHLS
jgi:hypothetical protein